MTEIPINDLTPRNRYVAAGGETDFDYTFPVFAQGHLVVRETDPNDLDNPTTLTISTHYTVTGVGDENGGTIVLNPTAYPSGATEDFIYTITREMPLERQVDYQYSGDFETDDVNRDFDSLLLMIQQNDRKTGKAVSLDDTDELTALPIKVEATATRAGKALAFDDAGTKLEASFNASDIANASTYASQVAADKVTVAADKATTLGYKNDAAASAAAAAAVLDAAMFSNVVFLTSASSPYTVTQANNGDLLSIDTTSGNVVINLPAISSLTLPFTVGIKKTSSDSNTVTINRGGASDTIDGATSKVLSTAVGTALIPDTDPSPDTWTSADFGQPLTLASQAEAEAGSENTKYMTALRVSQAITALSLPRVGAISTPATPSIGVATQWTGGDGWLSIQITGSGSITTVTKYDVAVGTTNTPTDILDSGYMYGHSNANYAADETVHLNFPIRNNDYFKINETLAAGSANSESVTSIKFRALTNA